MAFNRLPLEEEQDVGSGAGMSAAPDSAAPDPADDTMKDSFGQPMRRESVPIQNAPLDKGSLASQEDDAMKQKRQLAKIGGIADAVGNGQSWGNFFLGHMNPENHGALKATQAIADTVQDPIDQKERLNKYMSEKYGLDKQAREEKAVTGTDTANYARTLFGDKAPAGVTNEQFGRMYPLLKAKMDQDLASKKADASLAMSGARIDLGRQRLGKSLDDQTAHAGDRISRDPRIQTLDQQDQVLGRGAQILSRPDVTVQEFNDGQIELGNAIAGAKSGALGKLERTEYDGFDQKLAGLKQSLTGLIPGQSVPPEIRQRVLGLINETRASFAKHKQERAESLKSNYSGNAAANQRQDQVISGYKAQPIEQAPAPAASPVPKPGAVHDGYVFKGGDPSKQESWVKQ